MISYTHKIWLKDKATDTKFELQVFQLSWSFVPGQEINHSIKFKGYETPRQVLKNNSYSIGYHDFALTYISRFLLKAKPFLQPLQTLPPKYCVNVLYQTSMPDSPPLHSKEHSNIIENQYSLKRLAQIFSFNDRKSELSDVCIS